MAKFFARQPNGLLCRYSTIVDSVTHWNMSEKDFGNELLGKSVVPFSNVKILLRNETEESRYEKYKDMGCSDEMINNLIEGLDEEC